MKLNHIERTLLASVVVSAIVAVLAYVARFHRLQVGDPADWSGFGDYFGGVLNPIIGIATVILVVQTLRTTRREAQDTRSQMAKQIGHLERQAVLADMQKRLEGALVEWNRQLDRVALQEFQHIYISETRPAVSETTIREVLESPERLEDLWERKKADKDPITFVAEEWRAFKRELIPLLCEMDQYCIEYEKVAESAHLTRFYKARVRVAARALKASGFMPSSVADRLIQGGLDR